MPKYIMWRINPKECDYDKLDEVDIFSSASKSIKNMEIEKGDFICAVASGKNAKIGLHGIWRVLREPYCEELKVSQKCYKSPYDKERMKLQWRVLAEHIIEAKYDNLDEIREILPKNRLKIPCPSILTEAWYLAMRNICE